MTTENSAGRYGSCYFRLSHSAKYKDCSGMSNAISVLWRTCVKFTKLQNLIFFFSSFFFSLVSPTTCFLWYIFFLPFRHSFISDPFRCFELPTPPIFCSVSLFLQLLCSNRSNDDRPEEAKIRFFVARCAVQPPWRASGHDLLVQLCLGQCSR